jgi:hypothetical protein
LAISSSLSIIIAEPKKGVQNEKRSQFVVPSSLEEGSGVVEKKKARPIV